MSDDRSLPEGWVREFEGPRGAEYYHDQRWVSIQVIPQYDPPGRRASESDPVRYLIRLQRPYSDRLGTPIRIGTVESFQDAVDIAKTFMRGFSERYAGRSVKRAAAETLAAVAGYSDDRLVDIVVDRTETTPGAVVHVTEDGIEPVYGVESPDDTVGNVTVEALCGRVRRASGDLATAVGDGDLRATVTVTDDATVVWIAVEGGGTLIALDADATVSLPTLARECRSLLSRRSER